jgi:hypothetical protein
MAKDIDDFDFDSTAVNETLVRDLASGGFSFSNEKGSNEPQSKIATCNTK